MTVTEQITDSIFGAKWTSKTICAGAQLGVFDHLALEHPRAVGDVAREMHVDENLLYRLLRALASLGYLHENHERCFALTEYGLWLRTDTPGSLRYMALLEGGIEHTSIWNHVPDMVREGQQNAFVREFGRDAFEHARANPDSYGEVFDRAMSAFSVVQSALVLEALRHYDFSSITTMCDVAGGHGHLMCSLLQVCPHMAGIVFDLPEVLAQENALWSKRLNLIDRCQYVAGDMFDDAPVADAYILKMILHDWSDIECADILSNIKRRAEGNGRLFIAEHVVPGPTEPHFAKLFDIHMMCWGTGRERTEAEFEGLLSRTGWEFVGSYYPRNRLMGVIEARAA